MLEENLPSSQQLPPGSKVYITSGSKPEIKILKNIGKIVDDNFQATLKQAKYEETTKTITNSEQIKTLNEIYYYNLLMKSPDIEKNSGGKYSRAIDRIHAENYPKREQCSKWPCL